MQNRKIKLSQCMIVKNEEDNIEKALSWGKQIMWEQIVVDTGSTDRTVELAESLGVKVYHFPWIDDFSAAKNFAIEQASGDWIAFLDADEYIKEEDVGKILPMLQLAETSGYDAVRTDLLSIDRAEKIQNFIKQTRFFKRLPDLRYEGIIHECLFFGNGESINSRLMEDQGSVTIYHTGYAPEEMEKKKKKERNHKLLSSYLQLHPDDYYAMGDMGDHYLTQDGKIDEAESWYRKAVERIPKIPAAQCDRNVKSFLMLMRILLKKGNGDELQKLYHEMMTGFRDVYDADYMMAKYYVETRGDYQKGADYLERALGILEKQGTGQYGPMLLRELPEAWELLAECYYKNGHLSKCVSCCVALLKADKKRVSALTILLHALAGENVQAVLRFLMKLYDLQDPNDKNVLMQACQEVGAEELIRKVENIDGEIS